MIRVYPRFCSCPGSFTLFGFSPSSPLKEERLLVLPTYTAALLVFGLHLLLAISLALARCCSLIVLAALVVLAAGRAAPSRAPLCACSLSLSASAARRTAACTVGAKAARRRATGHPPLAARRKQPMRALQNSGRARRRRLILVLVIFILHAISTVVIPRGVELDVRKAPHDEMNLAGYRPGTSSPPRRQGSQPHRISNSRRAPWK
jgi:hypothetical protein